MTSLGLGFLRRPVYLVVLAVVMLLTHLILTREGLRDGWHQRMEALKVKLPDPPSRPRRQLS